MRQMANSVLAPIRSALTKHPSPEDAASVVHGTPVGALVTAFNAIAFAANSYQDGNAVFLAFWLPAVLVLCLTMTRKSRKAARHRVSRVSPRAARILARTSALLALPWAALVVYVFAAHGPGEPMIVMLVCVGMLSGGAFMLHRAFVAALCYMLTILVPVIFSLHFGGWDQAWSVTAFAAAYGVFLAYFAFTAGETARQRDDSVAALSDAVARLKRAHDENFLLANVDDVTGLVNRKAFNDRLREAVDRQKAGGCSFSLLLMDLDRFKNVNDLFGHGVGDELLAEVSRRLRANLSEGDLIGRLGGDEFCILLPGATDEAAIQSIAGRLLRVLHGPARLTGGVVYPGASFGAAICPDDAADPVDLLLRADLALNHAKETGRGQCVTFNDQLRQQLIASDEIEAGLRIALREDRLSIAYQPKISLRDGQAVGAEALVRWKTAGGENIPPDRFLSIAAERGVLPDLSRHIAEMIAGHILTWRRAALSPGKIALNIHPDDLKSPELLMSTIAMFEAQGIDGNDLLLEITEGCFIGRGTDMAAMVLDSLADRGYELSLDDFGTGHASLSHLKKIPVSEVKIDRSFVAGLAVRRDDRAIVAAIAEITKGMGIRSVAEGVEHDTQRAILTEMGIDLGQGHLWSRPITAEQYASFLGKDGVKRRA
ncbi:diguanylate cyclase/phosphodiesterase [Rhodovulum kholense]|uniref:Diguanylate cyclase/phosphodiesterase n=2 Tax=Rhodovulum TaxID=34008 RepID=A0A8E3ARD5_9RHOB|nr:diguanylate cyclase/phosphodiesterase [Rhodovulum kholense]